MTYIATIAGSPSANARSTAILGHAQRLMRRNGVHTHAIVVRSLPAEDLLHARLDSPVIQEATLLIDQADAVVIATPIYKGAYSGILKAFLDLLPQDAFRNKRVLPIATGGSTAYLPAIDYTLKPVLSALGACCVLRGIYVQESQVQIEHGGLFRLDDAVYERLREALEELASPPDTARLAEAAA